MHDGIVSSGFVPSWPNVSYSIAATLPSVCAQFGLLLSCLSGRLQLQ